MILFLIKTSWLSITFIAWVTTFSPLLVRVKVLFSTRTLLASYINTKGTSMSSPFIWMFVTLTSEALITNIQLLNIAWLSAVVKLNGASISMLLLVNVPSKRNSLPGAIQPWTVPSSSKYSVQLPSFNTKLPING